MPSSFTTIPYTLDDILLASFVPTLENPHQDALDPLITPKKGEDYKIRGLTDFKDKISNNSHVTLRSQLSKLFTLSHEGSQGKEFDISSISVHAYELTQPKIFFKELCKLQKVRDWIQQAIEDGDDIFFITGYYTFKDAKVQDQSHNSSNSKAKVGIHVKEILARGAPVPSIGEAANLDTEAQRGTRSSTDESWTAPGERIFGIWYRKVSFKWFKEKSGETAVMGRTNRWRMVSDDRADEVEAEVVEVDLEDEVEAESEIDM
jgi:hypothetical protein